MVYLLIGIHYLYKDREFLYFCRKIIDKMMTRNPLCLILALALFSACQRNTVETRPTIQYVRDILSDKATTEYQILSASAEPTATGDIVVIGSSSQCNALSTHLSLCDMFDNFDGTPDSDGLADFAGEYINSIIDEAGGAYASYLSEGKIEQLREKTVRSVICAVDSTYSLTAYDLEGKGRKSPAKVIVLADVHQFVYGKFDVDSLFLSTGCGISVVTPVEAMVRHAVPSESEGKLNIGVIASPEVTDSTVYLAALSEILQGREVNCYASHVSVADSTNTILAFLDSYIASGATEPLDAILVDDYDLSPAFVREGIRRASSLMSSESLVYGKYLSDNVRFACPAEAVSATCYHILRDQNLFTHMIALPQSISYKTVRHPEDEGMLLTPISFYVQN